MKGHGGTVDYEGHLPTYKHFGFLVTLIPILEALMAGFNVIYFDVDIALVKDPLPHMVTGKCNVCKWFLLGCFFIRSLRDRCDISLNISCFVKCS